MYILRKGYFVILVYHNLKTVILNCKMMFFR